MTTSSRVVRYRCTGCRKIKRGGASTRWCDDCGGELKKLAPGSRRRKNYGR